MSIWKNMQIFIAMYISFCSIISHAETIVDDEKLMNYAIVDFYKTYRESGIQGNIVEIKECYQNKTQILYCFYYDYLARIMDIEITRELGFSNDEFFNDENFHHRAENFYITILQGKENFDTSLDKVNKHLMELYHSLSDKLYKEIEKADI